MCLWPQGREERGVGGVERWGSREDEEMKEKNYIKLTFRMMLIRKKTMAKSL